MTNLPIILTLIIISMSVVLGVGALSKSGYLLPSERDGTTLTEVSFSSEDGYYDSNGRFVRYPSSNSFMGGSFGSGGK